MLLGFDSFQNKNLSHLKSDFSKSYINKYFHHGCTVFIFYSDKKYIHVGNVSENYNKMLTICSFTAAILNRIFHNIFIKKVYFSFIRNCITIQTTVLKLDMFI